MAPKFDSLETGTMLPEMTTEPVTQLHLIKYAGASGDFNPIHTIPEYAKEAGLDGTIIHGMYVMGVMGKMLSDWAGNKNIRKYGVNFKAMTKPGAVLTAGGEIKRKYEDDNGKKLINLKLFVKDETGDVKLDGKAVVECE
jgi:acyl dehydratase